MSDISHAHAVFLEITFGLNTVFAIYKELREYITRWFADMVEQYVAAIKGIETSEGDRAKVNHVAGLLQSLANAHLGFQDGLFKPVGWFAVAFALSAATILYFDWVGGLGYWCGILFVPLPAYAIMLVVNYSIFRFRGSRLVEDYKIYNELSTRFEPKEMPPPPEAPKG